MKSFESILFLVGATIASILAVHLATRHAPRFDVTATGAHRLSERTGRILDALTEEHEFVLAFDGSSPDARREVLDVLDEFERRTDLLRVTAFDTGTDAGRRSFEDLVTRLQERDAPERARRLERLRTAIATIDDLRTLFETDLVRALEGVRDVQTDDQVRAYFIQRIAGSQSNARGLAQLHDQATALLEGPDPRADVLVNAITPTLRVVRDELDALTSIVRQLEASDATRRLESLVRTWRDRAGVALDSISRMTTLDSDRVAEALQSANAAIVIGPEGLTAIRPELLLQQAPGADVRQNAEELCSTAIATVVHPVKPILLFVHAEPNDITARFRLAIRRLELRGVDVRAWNVVTDDAPPLLDDLDPLGERPVVHLVIGTNAAVTGSPSGPERAAALGLALQRLVEQDAPFMLCPLPSTLPAYGEPDPIVTPLAALGLRMDTAHPLLLERASGSTRLADPTQIVVGEPDALQGAIGGLPTSMTWPIRIESDHDDDPLLVVRNESWGESQWLGYAMTAESQRASIPDAPVPDENDVLASEHVVALAADRGGHRVMLVGSNRAFVDEVVHATTTIDGRVVPANPGNMELLDAGVFWLAGQDWLIARSASAQSVPIIRPIGSLGVLRLAVIVGLPVLILVLGLLRRALLG